MAKKKEEPTNETTNFSDLVDSMKKSNTLKDIIEDSYVLDECPYSKIEEYINTGNYLLNAQISADILGGTPEGRIVTLVGESGVGKTYVILNAAVNAQKMGYNIIWIDTENAMEIETAKRLGIDPKKFWRVPMDEIAHVTTYLKNLVDKLLEDRKNGKKIPKLFVAIDSIGNLSSTKESNDASSGSEKADMTKPKELKKLFRILTNKLGLLKIPVMLVGHVYANIGSFFGGNTIGGGQGPILNSHIILELSKAKLKEELKEELKEKERKVGEIKQTGIVVTSRVRKSRFTQAGINIKFHISYYRGMNPYLGLENFVSWDLCGIGIGKYRNGEFFPDNTGRTYAIKHLEKHINAKELFNSQVFTQEVLEKLRQPIKEFFAFKDADEIDDLYDMSENVMLLSDGEDDDE